MAIVIKKRVSLEFLGEEYKDAELVFKSIPVLDYGDIQKSLDQYKEDNNKALSLIIETLQKYFVSGKFPNETGQLADVTKDDLTGLDAESTIKCFTIFTGQELDPKAVNSLPNSSTTVETPPTSS